MSFADMMKQIGHPLSMPDEPASPDAVLVLEARASASACWPALFNVAKTPDKVGGKFIADYKRKAQPVPPEGIPRSFSVKEYEYKDMDEDEREMEWPANIEQVMPDFYSLRSQMFIVSSVLRECLEKNYPDCIEYIEVKVDTPPGMIRAPAYYYINVLMRAQMIDWPRVDMKALNLSGKRAIHLERITRKMVPFKPSGPNDPPIWHEMSIDDEGERLLTAQGDILVRGHLWNVLIEQFPLQFWPNTQLSHD